MRLAQWIATAIGRIKFIVELELVILTDLAQGIVFVRVFRATAARRLVIGCVRHFRRPQNYS